MTYCVAMRLDTGLVFLSDSRTHAGVDQVHTFRKMRVFENTGDRLMVLMCAGNLSISQSVCQLIADYVNADGNSIWTVASLYEAAQIVGAAIRLVHERDAHSLEQFGIDFNVSMIFGGQINGERCRLFQMYSAGNFIEAYDEHPYFQIGEAKYGKPIIDRVITRTTPLDEAAKCALISMDSTLRSNISVGFPLDLLVYEADQLRMVRFVTIDEKNQYFQQLRSLWGKQLRTVFEGIDNPAWDPVPEAGMLPNLHTVSQPVKIFPPVRLAHAATGTPAPLQTIAEQSGNQKQE